MNKLIKSLLIFVTCAVLSIPGMAAETVNINTASAQQIAAALDGVGLKKAEAIVAYRKAKGPFKSSHSLLAVKGIGESTLKRNQSKITLKN